MKNTIEFTSKDQEQLENLMMFAKLNNYILETEEDMKQLLKDWVNNGLKLMKTVTENKQCMDMMFNDYMTQQGLN
jgi:hypothetical protein